MGDRTSVRLGGEGAEPCAAADWAESCFEEAARERFLGFEEVMERGGSWTEYCNISMWALWESRKQEYLYEYSLCG